MTSRKSKILVVDDDQNQAELTARKLSNIDEIAIDKAFSGKKAFEYIEDNEYDCIVSDYDMEEMNGLELYEESRKHDENAPFILFTGKGSESVASKAITKGVTDYIRKDGLEQYDKLANRCEKALNTKKVEEELRERKTKFKKRKNVLEEFHEITNDNIDFEKKVKKLLELGTKSFGLKTGIFSRIVEHNYHVESLYSKTNGDIEEGMVFELSDTFCQTVREREEPVSFNREYSDKIEKHPAYEKRKLEVYLGVPVYVEGELYGTFNFSSDEKIGRRLDDEEKTIVRIMAEWIGKEIARQRRTKEAESKQKRLRQVIDNLPQLVFAKNKEGEFILANETVADYYGTTVEELEGSKDDKFADSKEEVEKFREDDERVIKEDKAKVIPEEKLTNAKGDERLLQTTKIPFDPPETNGKAVLGVSHDITEMKRQQKALEDRNERLDEFSSIVSHDLRNPLNVAMGYLDLFKDEGKEEDLEKIEESLERMKNIIDELMAVSSKSEDMQKEKVSLKKALETAISHKSDEIEYEVPESVEVYISSTGLISIFENLLSNTIKHNDPPYSVKVSRTDEGFYYVDNGELENDLEEIREYGFTSHPDGNGIGISIILRIAQVNNWQVNLTKTENGSLRYDFSTS